MSNHKRFNYLLSQYLSGKISVGEHDEFFALVNKGEFDEMLDRSIQDSLQNGVDAPMADMPPHIAQEIVRNIYTAEKSTVKIIPLKKKPVKRWYWMAAASIALVVLVSYFLITYSTKRDNSELAVIIPSSSFIEKNTTTTEKEVKLPDGSVILLTPQSKIHYPKDFNDSIREIYLEGDAFFSVAKNPEKPFFVYYKKIVTKVLGTSFRINTNPETGNPEVDVKTGKVQVSEINNSQKSRQLVSSVVITPNQKAIYRMKKGIFETTLVNAPEPIVREANNSKIPEVQRFSYEQDKLPAIFSDLEKAYGIEIIIENAELYNCVFTGDVSSEDLFTKLKMICLATSSTYEVNGTRILINGKGCK